MGRYLSAKTTITVPDLLARKKAQEKISMMTCYDGAFARFLESSTIDIVLVGDSLGNVVLGYDSTIPVTMDAMVHHCSAVSRVLQRPLLVADMPFGSFQVSTRETLKNAIRLVQEGGAHAVKIEGATDQTVKRTHEVVKAGIPVMGHLGLTPQSVHALGGFKVQGRGAREAEILDEAKRLEDAGVFSIVLELVPLSLAQKITKAVHVPTIGIGAGAHCDGQVLVLHDMLGFDSEFSPRFLKKYASLAEQITSALKAYDDDVKKGRFPEVKHSFE